MKKKILFGILAVNILLLFVSCGNIMGMFTEPELRYDCYDCKSYINGVLVKIKQDRVKYAKSFVLYYNGEEVAEFKDSIFIPSDPIDNYNNIPGYSICAKNNKQLSDPEELNIYSKSYILRTDYDVVLTQKSEEYDSITFEWELVLPDDLEFYDLENSELKCLISDNHYSNKLSDMTGTDIGNNQVCYSNPKSALKPASIYSSIYGCLLYSYTDLMGVRHNDIVTKLNSQKEYKGHTKALDKIENFSVTTKRTTAEVSFTELTEEQLHGLTNCVYMIRVTNKDDTEEKPTVKWLTEDETTGKYSISGLKPETNYQFDIFAAEYSSFAEFANMAAAEGKTAEALAALNAPTVTASDSYDENLKTSFTVEFEKHPNDTTETPMEYQVEYYLFKTTSPKTANNEYISYPSDGKITVSGINTGNTYKVVLKAREVSDPVSIISTDVMKVKTKTYSDSTYSSTYASYYTSSGTTYNWGTLSGKIVANNGYSKIDISSLYEYNAPKMLVINYSTSATVTLSNKSTKMGHFDVYIYRPDETEASPSKLKPVTMASYLNQTPEYTANLCGNFILDSYVYNDCLYVTPVQQYPNLYETELTEDYKVGITFVTNSSY